MKKISLFVLLFLITLAFVGCKGSDESNSKKSLKNLVERCMQ